MYIFLTVSNFSLPSFSFRKLTVISWRLFVAFSGSKIIDDIWLLWDGGVSFLVALWGGASLIFWNTAFELMVDNREPVFMRVWRVKSADARKSVDLRLTFSWWLFASCPVSGLKKGVGLWIADASWSFLGSKKSTLASGLMPCTSFRERLTSALSRLPWVTIWRNKEFWRSRSNDFKLESLESKLGFTFKLTAFGLGFGSLVKLLGAVSSISRVKNRFFRWYFAA